MTTLRPAPGTELRVLSAVGMRQILLKLSAKFDQATGHRLRITFDSGATIVQRIERGDPADVALVPDVAAHRLLASGKALAGSLTPLASARVGVAVRAGAPRPNIESVEALRQTLLAAASIARPDPAQGGSSGLHIQRVLEQLEIAEAVAPKTVLSSRPEQEDEMPACRVAQGDAEIALHQMQELLAVRGVTVIGPLPGDLDRRFLFSAVLVSGMAHVNVGRELIAFLTGERAKAVMKAMGMEPAG